MQLQLQLLIADQSFKKRLNDRRWSLVQSLNDQYHINNERTQLINEICSVAWDNVVTHHQYLTLS